MSEGTASLLQTILWILFIGAVLWRIRSQAMGLLAALVQRVHAGAAVGLGPVSIGEAPAGLINVPNGRPQAVTSEGAGGAGAPADLEDCLERKEYPEGVVDSVYLLHAAEVASTATPSGKPLYRVRIWVEADQPSMLDDIERVTYRLHDTFPSHVVSTSARGRNFELWLTVYGEFAIVGFAQRKTDSPLWLSRYLDLPGRPSD